MTVARYWREQKNRYNLLGMKCGTCGKVYFPPQEICRDCHRKSIGKMESIKLSGNGKIVSYTIIHDSVEAFKAQMPYVLAIIELDEGPCVTAQIVDVDTKAKETEDATDQPELAIGSPVKSVFRKISDDSKSGIIHYGYKFRLEP